MDKHNKNIFLPVNIQNINLIEKVATQKIRKYKIPFDLFILSYIESFSLSPNGQYVKVEFKKDNKYYIFK
jgi:hypothetical protein